MNSTSKDNKYRKEKYLTLDWLPTLVAPLNHQMVNSEKEINIKKHLAYT